MTRSSRRMGTRLARPGPQAGGLCHRARLRLEPLEGRVLLDAGPITIQGQQFVQDGSPVFLNIIGYQPLGPGQTITDAIDPQRVQDDLALLATFQGGSDPVVLRVYPQPTATLPVRMPKAFYDGMRDLDFWIIRDVYFDDDYWAADAQARGQAKIDAVLNEVAAVGGQDRILAWEIGNEFLANTQPEIDALKGFLGAMVTYLKQEVQQLWPTGVSDYVTWGSWPPSDPLRTDGNPIVVDGLDFASYNAYSYEPVRMRDHQAGPGTGTPFAGYLTALRAWYDGQGYDIPIVLSETGYSDDPTIVPAHAQYHSWAPQYTKGGLNDAVVAEALADRYWDARLSGAVAGFGLFEWNDEWHKGGDPNSRNHPEEYFGLIAFDPTTHEAQPKPQFDTVRQLFSLDATPGLIQSLVPNETQLGPEDTTTLTVQVSGLASGPCQFRWEASRGYIVNTVEVADGHMTVEFYAGGRALGPATITAIAVDSLGQADTASVVLDIQPTGGPSIEILTLGPAAASGTVANVDLGQFKLACWIETNANYVQPYQDMTSVWVRPDGYWWTPLFNGNDGDLHVCLVPTAFVPADRPAGNLPPESIATASLLAANDADSDLLPDAWEQAQFAGPGDPLRFGRFDDPDADGADTLEELLAGTLPAVADNDSDGDGLKDNWERGFFGSLAPAAAGDPDQDGTTTLAEQGLGTNPARMPMDVGFTMLHFGGRTTASYLDANQRRVTVSLRGLGAGEVWLPAAGQGDAIRIALDGTTEKSSLTIAVAVKGAGTTVQDIVVTGSLASLSAPTTALAGDLTVTGGLGKLALGDVAAQHLLSIGSNPLIKPGAYVLGRVLDATLTSAAPIKSLAVSQWLDSDGTPDTITAPWLGSLTVGSKKAVPGVLADFEAGLTLDGSGNPKQTLGKAAIAGTLRDAVWALTGSVGTVTVGRWGAGAILAIGVPPGPDGDYFTGDDVLGNGSLKGLTIAAYDTAGASPFGVTAAHLGKITLAGMKLAPAALPFQNGQFRILWAPNALHKGVALPLWNENVDLVQLRASLANLKAIGVNWVELNVFWFQDDINSTAIAPDFTRWSASDASVRAAIDAVHAQGMRVMLKPMVDLRNDPTHWRGNIPGSVAWFTDPQGYGAFLNHWAAIAQEKGVEMLCVGTELATASAQEASWRTAIAGVRALYSGPLVYAANQGGAASATEESIAWWDALDYIGLDAYYPLTAKTNPTLAELQTAWAARSAMIETWLAGLDPADRKPVLFTEAGYRSWDGANIDPASQSGKGSANVDLQEQADCYQALFTTLWRQESWFDGVFWWNWEVDPNPTWEAPNWYTPQGKPAQAVIQQFYA